MRRFVILICTVFLSTTTVFSQEEGTLKEKALAEFKVEHYNEAIALLEQALK